METLRPYKTGIALSGGGAKAGAHCGALQALSEYGIKPDIMAGTSAGALAAVFYSSGMSPLQMIESFSGMSFFKDIVSPNVPKSGLFDSKPLLEHIRKHIPYKRLEDLPIPTYVIASDLEQGRVKVFTEGELAPIVVASCSIPVVFTPVCIEGHHYVDGGAFMNLPVPAIRDCCEKVYALDLNHIYEEEYRGSIVSVAIRSFMMTLRSNALAEVGNADLYVSLDTFGASQYDMSKITDLYAKGYESTIRALEENGYSRLCHD